MKLLWALGFLLMLGTLPACSEGARRSAERPPSPYVLDGMFEKYIIGSPSLWFDRRVAFAQERNYRRRMPTCRPRCSWRWHRTKPLNFSADNARYNKTVDMVRDLQSLEHVLAGRHYPSLDVETIIIPDEDHLTVFPSVITRGLKWALPPERGR